MWNSSRVATPLLVLLAGAAAASAQSVQSAQDPSRPFLPDSLTRVVHRGWGVEDGLPVNGILGLSAPSSGYLWIGTEEGLVRYDGDSFQLLGPATVPALPAREVTDLVVDDDGTVWIATRGRGLGRVAAGETRLLTTADGLPSDIVHRVIRGADGSVWAGTRGGGVARVRGDTVEAFGVAEGLPHSVVTSLAEGPEGVVWVGTRGGLASIRDGRVEAYDLDPLPPSTEIEAVTVRGDRVWIATGGTEAGIHSFPVPGDGPVRNEVPGILATRLMTDSRNRLWFTTTEEGVGLLPPGGIPELFTSEDGLTSDFTTTVVEDPLGGVWIGTASGGLNLLRRPEVRSLTERDGLSSSVALPIVRGRADTMWVGTAGGGVNRISPDGTVERPSWVEQLPSLVVLSLLAPDDGTLWVGTRAGLTRISSGGSVRTFSTSDGLPASGTISLAEDPGGGTWVGTIGGLARIDGDAVTSLANVGGLPAEIIFSLLADSSGVWVGSQNRGLIFFDGSTARPATDPPVEGEVLTIHREGGQTFWLGTSTTGLVRVRRGEIARLGPAQGLPGNQAYQILDDGRGRLWSCNNQGAFALDRQELAGVAEGSRDRLTPFRLGAADGMPSSECNGGVSPAGAHGPGGTIWFPTMGGVAIIDPATALDQPVSPPVHLQQVIFDDSVMDPDGISGESLAAGTRRLEVHYTAPTPSLLGDVVFRFRLEGVDEDWVDAGSRRSAFYTNLGPGAYTFRAQAMGRRGGMWGDEATLSFRVAAHPWENPWLVGAALLGVIALVGVGIRRRMNALARRNAELQALIEDRERAERAAEEAEVQYRQLMETAQEMVVRTDDEGRILTLNRAARSVLGVGEDELDDLRVQDLFSLPPGGGRQEDLLGSLDGTIREVVVRNGDGAGVSVELSGQAIPPGQGGPGFLIVGRDLSERRLLESQVRQAQKMEAVGKLAAGVAHDFNNVLAVIMSSAGLVKLDIAGGPVADEVEEILTAARHGSALTRQLLSFSRPSELGQERTASDLNDLVREMRGMLERIAGPTLTFRTELRPDRLPVRVDVGQMRQIVMNLVVNARDAMSEGGEVTVRTDAAGAEPNGRVVGALEPGPYATLSVADTGPGIPEEHLGQIFDPFFTTKEGTGGTGLGLATAFGIARDHGGALSVATERGVGTTFTLWIPLAEVVPPEAGPPRILVLEDDETLRQLEEVALRGNGYEVTAVASVQEARRSVEAGEDWAGFIIDVHLADESGLELVGELRGRGIVAPIILVSGRVTGEMEAAAESHPAVHILAKPYRLGRVVELVSRVVGEPEQGP